MPSTLLDTAQKIPQPAASPFDKGGELAREIQDRILPAMLAGMLGLMLLYAAGFSDIAPLHNAAHDGRHSASFPCH